MRKFTIGCDPELFIKFNGNFIASCGMVGGTKEEPLQLEGLPEGYTIQEDNVAVEFGIPPAKTRHDFTQHISTIMQYLNDSFANRGVEVAVDASAIFPEEALIDPRAWVFGCEPDLNVWLRKPNPRPTSSNKNLRSAGGHVHVGITDEDFDTEKLIKCMDLFLGVPSVLMDKDTTRKELYGKAGAFRFKPYGVEYRVLSNFWVKNPSYTDWVYNQTNRAVEAVDSQFAIDELQDAIVSTINTNDTYMAKQLVNKFGLEVVNV
jgi:hypothetical protein